MRYHSPPNAPRFPDAPGISQNHRLKRMDFLNETLYKRTSESSDGGSDSCAFSLPCDNMVVSSFSFRPLLMLDDNSKCLKNLKK